MTPEVLEEAIAGAVKFFADMLPRQPPNEQSVAIAALGMSALGDIDVDQAHKVLLLRQALYPPKRKRGGDKFTNAFRDIVILHAIHVISHDFRLDATRNPATNGECACSIVEAALKRCGLGLSESTIAKIWQKKRHLYPELQIKPPVGN